MSNLFLTLKPINAFQDRYSFGVLADFDLKKRKMVRTLKFPAAGLHSKKAFMKPTAQGLAISGEFGYVALWNHVAIVNLKTFEIVNVFSAPELADVHSIALKGNDIYVASTATECIVCFDIKTLAKKWVWGPAEPILMATGVPLLPNIRNRIYYGSLAKLKLRKFMARGNYPIGEARAVHKRVSPHYRHHLNQLTIHDNSLWVGTKGWFDTGSSSVISVDTSSLSSEFIVRPGGFLGCHDGEFYNGSFFVTEADSNSLAWLDVRSGKIRRHKLFPEGRFVRGLAQANGLWFIGFTSMRDAQDALEIGVYSQSTLEKIDSFSIPSLHGSGGTAVHSIAAPKCEGEF